MDYNIYHVFRSQFSHEHVSGATAAILRMMILLQEHGGIDMVSCVVITL